jgi:hypothetical protein
MSILLKAADEHRNKRLDGAGHFGFVDAQP